MTDINLKIPLIIDTILLLTIAFNSGVMWTQVAQVQRDVAALKTSAQVDAPKLADRLARIETLLERMQADVNSLKR